MMNAPASGMRRMATSLLVAALATGLISGVGGCAAFNRSVEQGTASPGRPGATSGTVVGGTPPNGLTKDSAVGAAGAARSSGAAAAPAASTVQGTSGVQRLVVRDSTVRLRVKDVSGSAKKIALLTQASGGYIESMQLASDAGGTVTSPEPVPVTGSDQTQKQGVSSSGAAALSGYVRVRVPVAKLTAFTRDVSTLGEVVYQATDAQDVTAQHVDMVARLKNLQSAEADLRRLSARANTVGEVLAVQRELTRVQGEIESLQAQIAVLESQASMAAVTVQLVGPEAIVAPSGDSWGFTDALRTSVRAFVGTINVMIVALGALLPIIAIFALLAWLVWWLVRRSNPRHAARLAEAAAADDAEAPADSADDAEVLPSEPGAGAAADDPTDKEPTAR
jgi:hypothetical protein